MSASEGAPQQDPASQTNVTTVENEQTIKIQIESQDYQNDRDSDTEELEIAEDSLTTRELDDVTTVFRQYETGLRGGCISVKVTKKQLLIIIRKAFFTRISTELSSHWVSR